MPSRNRLSDAFFSHRVVQMLEESHNIRLMNASRRHPVPGTQAVSRAAHLLRTLAQSAEGLPFAEVIAETGLTRPTTHRMLSALKAEGLVDHDVTSGLWRLGPEALIWGAVAASRLPLEDVIRPVLRRLAEATGESSFYSIRRGDETVCLLREEGSFPIRSFVLHEGVRFPLGVASAGIAILAFLDDDERERLLADRQRIASAVTGHTREELEELLDSTHRLGYSVNPGRILEGSWGLGAAVFDRDGHPVGALSLTGIEQRFRGERGRGMGRLLLDEAHGLGLRLQATSA